MAIANTSPVKDLREYVDVIDDAGLLREVEGADWEYEIGALTEIGARVNKPKALLFDSIKDYAQGYRILSLPYVTDKHHALALGLSHDASSVELIREWKERIQDINRIEPNEVSSGPVQENIFEGDDVDVLDLPAPIWNEKDGGRFIGTGNAILTRGPPGDEDWNWVNAGVYRNQVHDRNTLGLWINQTNQAIHQMRRWWERGESAPIVVDQGPEPYVYVGACAKLQKGDPELEYGAGLKGEPIDVIYDGDTGLPVPARSEIAMIGHVPPPEEETHPEGPFGECFGYYAGGAGLKEERIVIKVDKLWHRNDPILKGCPELKDQAHVHALGAQFGTSAKAWETVERNVENVRGVYSLYQTCQQGSNILVISIEQEFGGHPKQAGLAAASAQNAMTGNMMTIVVDDDIDPSDPEEVFFAMTTRCTPDRDIDIVRNTASFELDPRPTPWDRERGDFTNSIAIVDACIPYHLKEEYPEVVDFPEDYKAELADRFNVNEWD